MSVFNVTEGSVLEFVTGTSVYIVPKYQRPYSWTNAQLERFWQDLMRLYRGSGSGGQSTHFLGPVVLGTAQTDPMNTVTRYSVIDGQQRIITLQLLLAAYRDVVEPEEQRDAFDRRFLVHETTDGRADLLRVIPNEADAGIFEKAIRRENLGTTVSRVAAAYKFFVKKLELGAGEPDRDPDEIDPDVLPPIETDAASEVVSVSEVTAQTDGIVAVVPFEPNALKSSIVNDLRLVTISNVPDDLSYQVFETLNATGLPLTQVDLLRNGFFMLMPDRGDEVYEKIWKPLEATLGGDLEEFFHTNVMRRGRNVSRPDTYSEQIRLIKESSSVDQWFENLLTLKTDGDTYAALMSPSSNPPSSFGHVKLTQRAQEQLQLVRDWRSPTPYPLLLDAAARVRDGSLDLPALIELASMIESLLVRRFICLVPPNDLRSRFAAIMEDSQLRATRDEASYMAGVKNHLLSASFKWPDNENVSKALLEQPFYRPASQRYMRFIFRELARQVGGKETPEIKLVGSESDFSIEHIFPQNPSPEWASELDARGEDALILKHEKLHTIGNLTLVAYNAELSNAEFRKKQEFYRSKDDLRISDDVWTRDDYWGADAIDERGRKLAKAVLKRWPRTA
jgi:hypothetical protein